MKLHHIARDWLVYRVAPLAGAWIEITPRNILFYRVYVAPLAGVWIEITLISAVVNRLIGRPPRGGRGLKSLAGKKITKNFEVAPSRGAWIEIA